MRLAVAVTHTIRPGAPRNLRRTAALSCVLRTLLAVAVLSSTAASAAQTDTIELYESYGTYTLKAPPADMQPITLDVPHKFRYGSSKGKLRDWGVNILTFYPGLTSPSDPENVKFGLDCVGICNGRILVAVRNRTHSVGEFGSPNMGDFIAHAAIRWNLTPPYPPNVHVAKLGPRDGFDDVFEVTTRLLDSQGRVLSKIARTEQFYFRRADHGGDYDLAATCDVSSERTTCTLHFSLLCDPRVYVSVNGLNGSYLPMATDIKGRVDRFVSAMVKEPMCIK